MVEADHPFQRVHDQGPKPEFVRCVRWSHRWDDLARGLPTGVPIHLRMVDELRYQEVVEFYVHLRAVAELLVHSPEPATAQQRRPEKSMLT